MNFKCILGIQDKRHRLRSRPMYVLFRYGIQTFYTAIIMIMMLIMVMVMAMTMIMRVMMTVDDDNINDDDNDDHGNRS